MDDRVVPARIGDPSLRQAGGRGRPLGLRGTAFLLAKCAVTGASLWWVSRVADLHTVWTTLHAATPVLLGMSFIFFLLMAVLGGLRWWALLRGMAQPGHIGPLISLCWTGMVLNQMLPSAAGDTVRVWLAHRRGCTLRAAINSIVLDRVLMLVALLLIVLATQPLLAHLLPASPPIWVPALLAAAAVAGMLVLSVADLVAARLPHWKPLVWAGLLGTDTRAVIFSAWGPVLALMCLLGNLNFVAAGAALGAALGLPIPLLTYVSVIPLVVVVTVLPISIAGWGLREGLLVELLSHVGVAPGAALAYSVMFGVLSAAASLPGLVFWWQQPSRAAMAVRV